MGRASGAAVSNDGHRDLDAVLEEDVRDVLDHDGRLDPGGLDVAVRGGVVHVAGGVRDEAERRLVRRVVSRVAGVLAVWDALVPRGRRPPRTLDVGCGATKQWASSIGFDQGPTVATDVVGDMEAGLPFATASIDRVFAVHVLEHVHDLFGVLDELHRVLHPDGVLHVLVPHWQHRNAVADPTHVRFFARDTLRYFWERDLRRGRGFEPATVNENEDTIFADLEPVHGGRWRRRSDVLARCFT